MIAISLAYGKDIIVQSTKVHNSLENNFNYILEKDFIRQLLINDHDIRDPLVQAVYISTGSNIKTYRHRKEVSPLIHTPRNYFILTMELLSLYYFV